MKTISSNKNMSIFLSLILRHKPEEINLKLDKHGWANVQELIEFTNKNTYRYLTMEQLEEIVRTDNKQRYSFNEDHTKIRANQGHSINVDVELKEIEPPDFLFHGTARKYVDSILREGIKSQSRLYVHLSKDKETAMKVGARHGEPIVFVIDSMQMGKDGYKFFLSENNVWLTKYVPKEYLLM